MRDKTIAWIASLLVLGIIGCSGAVKEESIAVQSDPTEAVQQTLQRYADGMQVSSEVTNFPNLVSDMKAVDPAKGEILEKGLAEIEKNPVKAKSTAQELLKKLGLEKDASKDEKTK